MNISLSNLTFEFRSVLYAYWYHIHISMIYNAVVRTIFDWFGGTELMECYQSLDLDVTRVLFVTICNKEYGIESV